MNDLKRRWLWLALGTVMAMSLLWELVPRSDATARLNRLPGTGFHLFSRDIPLNVRDESTGVGDVCNQIEGVVGEHPIGHSG